MHIDQLLVGASPSDAVTESALRIRDALRGAVEADVYALHVDERMLGEVGRLENYPMSHDRSASDVIIFHASIGDSRVLDFILHRDERVIVVYHNITPASFFAHVDPEFAALLDTGRRQLPALLARAEAVIADSEFNADELRALGRDDVVVCAPPVRLRRLLEIESDPNLVAQLPVAVPGKMALFVGQALPHKRPDFLIGAHHLFATNYAADARLVMAGNTRHVRYANGVKRLVAGINLDTVWLTGEVSEAQLATFYRRADLFVSASEHEGFCVPLIEAFHFGVPVLARDFGAITATAGDAAIILPSDAGPQVMAEAMRRIYDDHDLRAELVARGHRRAEDFNAEALCAAFVGAVRDVLARLRVRV